MKFEVKLENKGDMVSDHVFCDWSECRNFLLVLTDNRVLIRDIAESLLQVGVYEHCNKWYTLRVTCEHDVTIGEALKTVAEYGCTYIENCKHCSMYSDEGSCLSILAKEAMDKISKTELSEKEAHYCAYDCKIVKHMGG